MCVGLCLSFCADCTLYGQLLREVSELCFCILDTLVYTDVQGLLCPDDELRQKLTVY